MARKFGIFVSFRVNKAQKRWIDTNGGSGRVRRMVEDARTGQATLLTPPKPRRKVSPRPA